MESYCRMRARVAALDSCRSFIFETWRHTDIKEETFKWFALWLCYFPRRPLEGSSVCWVTDLLSCLRSCATHTADVKGLLKFICGSNKGKLNQFLKWPFPEVTLWAQWTDNTACFLLHNLSPCVVYSVSIDGISNCETVSSALLKELSSVAQWP